jgi:hypothetical protein
MQRKKCLKIQQNKLLLLGILKGKAKKGTDLFIVF